MERLISFILFLSGILGATTHCTISAVAQQIAAEGATEPAGSITLACSGASPALPVEGSLSVSYGKRVSNRLAGEFLDGPVLEMETAPGVWSAFPSRAVLTNTSTVNFDDLHWTADSSGSFTLRVRGVRIEGAAELIYAGISPHLTERIESTSFQVVVASGTPAMRASTQSTLATRGPSPPDDADFSAMVHLGSPFVAVRVSEGFPSAFTPSPSTAVLGTRLLIRFAGVPDGVRILAPDVVVGSTGMVPTKSGGFGSAAGAGQSAPFGSPQLTLIRVVDAEINGQGGWMAANAATAGASLGMLRASSFSRGTPYVVYEVTSSDSTRLESAEIPAWVAVPPRFDTPYGESVVRATVALAPISENDGVHPTAPIPRYRPGIPASDCEFAGDCNAAWFPKMRLVEPAPLSFTAESGGKIQVGFAGINNDGGGLLEWRVSVRSKQNASWLTVNPGDGVQNGGVRYDLNPAGLPLGDYAAELVFEQLSPPTGRRVERVYPISLKVTAAAPAPPSTTPPATTPPTTPGPSLPTPLIQSVAIGPAHLAGPFAPSSVLSITGIDFGAAPTATVSGGAAVILAVAAGELTLVLPESTPTGKVPLIVTSNGRSSVPWFIEVVPVAPVSLFALNADGERNGESTPDGTGQTLDLYVTGIPAGTPVSVRLHDRTLSATAEDGGAPGVKLIRVQVPADLPAMQTSIVVETEGRNSHPLNIWVR